jgi:hypothetical protein
MGSEARAVEEFTTETPVLTIGDEQMLAASIGSYVVIRQANIAHQWSVREFLL